MSFSFASICYLYISWKLFLLYSLFQPRLGSISFSFSLLFFPYSVYGPKLNSGQRLAQGLDHSSSQDSGLHSEDAMPHSTFILKQLNYTKVHVGVGFFFFLFHSCLALFLALAFRNLGNSQGILHSSFLNLIPLIHSYSYIQF